MKTFCQIFLGSLLLVSLAEAKAYRCEDLVSPELKQLSSFDSTQPHLSSTLTAYNPNGTVKSEVTTTFLAANRVGNIDVNFKADCEVSEKESPQGYKFSFVCTNLLFCELYVDEGGFGRFSCEGQIVTQLFDCKTL